MRTRFHRRSIRPPPSAPKAWRPPGCPGHRAPCRPARVGRQSMQLAHSADVRVVATTSVPSPESAPDRVPTSDSLPAWTSRHPPGDHPGHRAGGCARRLDRRIWLLAVARFVVTAGFAAVMPFLAIHLAVERHFPILRIGLLWTVVGLVSASMQWVAGQVTDRLGRRRVLLAAMVLRSVNLAALGWAIGGARLAAGHRRALSSSTGPCGRSTIRPPRRWWRRCAAARPAGDRVLAAPGGLQPGLGRRAAGGDLRARGLVRRASSTWPRRITLLAAGGGGADPRDRPDDARRRRLRLVAAGRVPRATGSSCASCWPRCRSSCCRRRCTTSCPSTRPSTWASIAPRSDRCSWSTASWWCCCSCPRCSFIQRIGTAGALVLGSFGYVVAYCRRGAGHRLPQPALLRGAGHPVRDRRRARPPGAHHRPGARSTASPGTSGMGGLVQGIAQTSGPIVGSVLIELLPPASAGHPGRLLGIVGRVRLSPAAPSPGGCRSGVDLEHRRAGGAPAPRAPGAPRPPRPAGRRAGGRIFTAPLATTVEQILAVASSACAGGGVGEQHRPGQVQAALAAPAAADRRAAPRPRTGRTAPACRAAAGSRAIRMKVSLPTLS